MINFSKMHGLGNDFVVIDALDQPLPPLPIAKLSHRQLGIGFDQLLVIYPSERADFLCKIFNADGSEAEQCGNGLRCVARFLIEKGFTHAQKISIETLAGISEIEVNDLDSIQVAMGIPTLQPHTIPFQNVEITVVSFGNPHAVVIVPSLKNFPVNALGAEIAKLPVFPHSANVGFMEILTKDAIQLRTYERGVGETFACGSNACAAVVAGISQKQLNPTVKVKLSFGELLIAWPDATKPVLMTGPATKVYDGSFTLNGIGD